MKKSADRGERRKKKYAEIREKSEDLEKVGSENDKADEERKNKF